MTKKTKISLVLVLQLLPLFVVCGIIYNNLQPVSIPNQKATNLSNILFQDAVLYEFLSTGTDDDCDETDFDLDSQQVTKVPFTSEESIICLPTKLSPYRIFASGLEKNEYLIASSDLPPPIV
jgi:hypothetical protein